MQDKEWQKLDLPAESPYIELPVAFTGKNKNGAKNVFSGLLLSCQFILAVIHTTTKLNGGKPVKLTYDYFVNKYDMSRETVCKALNEIIEKRKIVECVKRSHYKITAGYNKTNRLKIFECWLKQEVEINGKKKRLARSRWWVLGLILRGCENPETGGEFISSQERIGNAVGLPRTTAGDAVRELIAADYTRAESPPENDKRRGCSLYMVNPDVKAVKPPKRLPVEEVKAEFAKFAANGFKQHDKKSKKRQNLIDQWREVLDNLDELEAEPVREQWNPPPRPQEPPQEPKQEPEELHARLMLDTKYAGLIERMNATAAGFEEEFKKGHLRITPEFEKLEAEEARQRDELEEYFRVHNINRKAFPPGFFPCDIT